MSATTLFTSIGRRFTQVEMPSGESVMGNLDTKPIVASRDPLFRPFTVKTLTLKNRIAMSAMGQANARDGVPDPGYPAYYRRRAEGEVGLVISGATAIPHPSAHMDLNEPHFHGEEPLIRWKKAVDEVHAAGGKMIPQLWHSGLHGLAYVAPTWEMHGPSGIWFPGPQPDGSAGPSEVRGEPMTVRVSRWKYWMRSAAVWDRISRFSCASRSSR
jgi:2,4-dienoyl-CoA reductase-like NADH-dependent reductase (Old Yellow Enzyme family)